MVKCYTVCVYMMTYMGRYLWNGHKQSYVNNLSGKGVKKLDIYFATNGHK